MDFKDANAIYRQIAERICDEILLKHYLPDERIPSVREYASTIEVNPNTVARSYELLQSNDIIYNKRGIGYFVSPKAISTISKLRKNEFIHEYLPDFFKRIFLLDISIDEIKERYECYITEKDKEKLRKT